MAFAVTVNGEAHSVDVEGDTPLPIEPAPVEAGGVRDASAASSSMIAAARLVAAAIDQGSQETAMLQTATLTNHPRHEQMFPTLAPHDVDRLSRFGETSSYSDGDRVLRPGEVAPGLIFVRSGKIEVTRGGQLERRELIVTHGPGQFLGELAQLSDRPSLVEAKAISPVEALVVRSPRLRALMVQEADLGERIMRALILRRVGLLESRGVGPIILGHAAEALVLRLQEFLRRNGQPYRMLDPEADACGRTLAERFEVDLYHLPIVICPNGKVLRSPSENELARCMGLVRPIDSSIVYDVAIVGAGPAGLAAAVYAGSEGLSVIALDCRSFGGQAGASARIENYLGFPTGISGMALMARAYNQAQKFGVEVAIPEEATLLESGDHGGASGYRLRIGEDQTVQARTLVIASGARYRRLDIASLAEFEGTSVHYWASPIEGQLCAGQEVALVGAGNSAGQAAVYLASHTKKVWLLVRRDGLHATMSRYLVERIAAQPNIEVLPGTEVVALEGRDGTLERMRWRSRASGAESVCPIQHLFLFIGADPNTDWLRQCGVDLDSSGFVVTGANGNGSRHALETNHAGVFAIGDVRSGSTKRVAAAVGEGAQVVAAIHAYLARQPASSKRASVAGG